jgi:TM2 domain-containing membrane protein YozV
LICIFPFAGFSGNKSPEFFKADSLQSAGQLELASLEYERICYGTFDNYVRTQALNEKAKCLLLSNKADAAEANMLRVNYFGLSDSLVFESRYRTAYCSYLAKDFEQAVSQCFMIDQFLPIDYQMQSAVLHALALNETREWDKAKLKLSAWAEYSIHNELKRDSVLSEIDAMYDPKQYPKFKDPNRANSLSTFVPGLGQLYSGYIFDAAFTTILMATGLGVAAVGIFVVKYYVTGIVLGYGIYQRFYMAGIKRSEYLANKRTYLSLRKFNDPLIETLTRLSSIE